MKNQIINIGSKISIAFVAIAIFTMPVLSVQAADLSEGGWVDTGYYETSSPSYDTSSDYGWVDTGYYDTWTPTYDTSSDYGWVDTGYYQTWQPTYDTHSSGYVYTYGGGGGGGGGGCTRNCGGGCGPTANCVPVTPAPVCTLTADRTNIQPGQDVRLTWTSQNAVSGTLSSYGSISLNSFVNLFPSHTTTYTATFTSQNGRSVTCTTTVTVTTPPPPVYNTPSCTIYINNVLYNNQYTTYGQPVTITWTSQNANYGYINQGIGSVNLSGSRTVYPTQSTVYTATFTGQNNQTVTCSVTVNINTYVPPPVYQNPVPYVTLSAVPYTGLDLGPVGTFLYWAFLIAWCALAAYLIAVKRVHMSIYNWYKKALFGETVSAPVVHVAPAGISQTELSRLAEMLRAVVDGASHKADTVPAVSETSGVDSFVLSQIHRGKRS